MGITGLIPFLKEASTVVNLSDLRGSSVAVDSYCWLHKGVTLCADKLIRGEDSDQYVNYCLKFVSMLLQYNIKVIMVFDGRHLPAKAETERRRREAREVSKKRVKELLRLSETEKARKYMRSAVDVTHEMAFRLIRACRERGVDCIVAPYEADAQMAWLNKSGLAEYIITEDSDLTVFGVSKILFKLNKDGSALLVEADKLHLAMGCDREKYTFDKFRRMCILSGCDYLDSLKGIGLMKACKFMLKTEEDDMSRALKKIPQYLKMNHLQIDNEYIESFLKAEATFRHMYIYNPLDRKMQRLYELEEFGTKERYCSNAGSLLEDEEAFQLAIGNLNPFTLKPMDDWDPDRDWAIVSKTTHKIKNASHKSIWDVNYTTKSKSSEGLKHVGNPSPPESAPMYFKKIEYKYVADAEIEANLVEERSKPGETEIFSMYKYNSHHLKRKRIESTNSLGDDNDVKYGTPPDSPVLRKKSHNPFVKVQDSTEKPKPSPVCVNKSLLNALSPRKADEQQQHGKQVEVKSRFFINNLMRAVRRPFAARDLSEEMLKIEEQTKTTQSRQSALYLHSPPTTGGRTANCEGSVEKSVDHHINLTTSNDEKVETIPTSQSTEASSQSSSVTINSSITNEEDLESSQDSVIIVSSSIPALTFTAGPTRRLGLSRPKKATSMSVGNRRSKTTKMSATLVEGAQKTLLMCGFQKRPKLT